MSRLWDAGGDLDPEVLRYTAGDDPILDRELVPWDILASRAHARMLRSQGHLTEAEWTALDGALGEALREFQAGAWDITPEDEDGHTALENWLVARIGDPGKAVHLGRSRNDQVLVALRLWLMDRLEALGQAADQVAEALEEWGARQGPVPMPGYTHGQRAMPQDVALWTGGWAAEVRDDAEAIRLARRRAAQNPLGSAAGYGVPGLSLDRERTTRDLGFDRPQVPVTAVQISRGKAEAEALFQATLLAKDLGRLAGEVCLFATTEYRFLRLPEDLTTGSSMMPQKRNPDVFERVRGRAAEALAALQEVLVIGWGLPSGYHRDLQGIKAPLFRGLLGVLASARVMARVIPRLSFDEDRLREAAADPALQATARVLDLVRTQGLPFREAYLRVKGGQSPIYPTQHPDTSTESPTGPNARKDPSP